MGLKGVLDHPANLCRSGFAGDATHLIEQRAGLSQPITGNEFAQTSVVAKLYRQRLFVSMRQKITRRVIDVPESHVGSRLAVASSAKMIRLWRAVIALIARVLPRK